MIRKIVADSSADLHSMDGVAFAAVPLTLLAGSNSWVDDETLDVNSMMDTLATWRGRSTSACPSPDAWVQGFGDADEVFCLPISSAMSGSYNSACIAARDYMEAHPDRKVFVIDTLVTSASMQLMCERLAVWINAGDSFDTITEKLTALQKRTRLLFCLRSVRSLANNGRVSQTLAALVGILNMRLIAIASEKGEAEMVSKARGDKKALIALIEQLTTMGYQGTRLLIHHCRNKNLAEALREAVRSKWPGADVEIGLTGGLCSFYAEDGGLLIGFEVG